MRIPQGPDLYPAILLIIAIGVIWGGIAILLLVKIFV